MELNATIIVQAAILLILMGVLSPALFGPALRVFEEREKRIHGAAEEAKKQLGSAGEKSAVVEQKLQAAQVEARAVLATLREKASEKERVMLEDARAHAARRLEESRAELAGATDSARASLKGEAGAMADTIVTKVLGRAA